MDTNFLRIWVICFLLINSSHAHQMTLTAKQLDHFVQRMDVFAAFNQLSEAWVAGILIVIVSDDAVVVVTSRHHTTSFVNSNHER